MDKGKTQELIDLLNDMLDAQEKLGNIGHADSDRKAIKVCNYAALLVSRLEELIVS